MKQRFLLACVMSLSLLNLAFPQAQSSANTMTPSASHVGMRGMKVAAPATASWRTIHNPNPGRFSQQLYGVVVVSAADVWAVGSGNFTADSFLTQTLVEQWNGTNWQVVPSPSPGAISNDLSDVAAVSATDVWAVGSYTNNDSFGQTLIEQWNGTSWRVVPSPNPAGNQGIFLNEVAVVSATNVWAVGSYVPGNGEVNQTLVEQWNGTNWSIVSSPDPGPTSNWLNGVVVVSSNDIWATGGYYNDAGVQQTLTEQWNGTGWSVVPSPSPGTKLNNLSDVTVVSSNDIWAVGYSETTNAQQTLIEQWNGASWSVVPSPNPSIEGDFLFGVATVSANDIWAVGVYVNRSYFNQTLFEQWNGTSWQVVPSPSPGTHDNDLYAVAAVSTNNVWAVGDYSFVYKRNTLIEHYSS